MTFVGPVVISIHNFFAILKPFDNKILILLTGQDEPIELGFVTN